MPENSEILAMVTSPGQKHAAIRVQGQLDSPTHIGNRCKGVCLEGAGEKGLELV